MKRDLNDFAEFSSWWKVAAFAVDGIAIVFAGVRMSAAVDRLADVTGSGDTATDAVLLGASDSLPGIVTSFTAAASGHPQLAISNAAGALLTGVVTSLPELVKTVSAVRRGALTLAVGGILGGNTFDVLFVAFSDVAYREVSIYHAFSGQQTLVFLISILMTTVLLSGLLRREKHGVANVGFESVLIIGIFVAGMVTMSAMPR